MKIEQGKSYIDNYGQLWEMAEPEGSSPDIWRLVSHADKNNSLIMVFDGYGTALYTPDAPEITPDVRLVRELTLVNGATLATVRAAMAAQREQAGFGLGPLPTEGVKFDQDKLPYHLIAPELLSSVADILAFGATKYSARNWEKGMAWHRPFRACIGHLLDWWRGAGPDEETGKSHLWHAACCIMFLVAYEARGIGEDDRPR